MKKNIILKVLILVFALLMVIIAARFINGASFRESLNMFFGPPVKTFAWCPDHTTDFKWNDQRQVSSKLIAQPPAELQQIVCKPIIEPIENLNLNEIQFVPLITAITAEAKQVTLEWNPDHQVFRSQGMPFKSSQLSRDLLDENR